METCLKTCSNILTIVTWLIELCIFYQKIGDYYKETLSGIYVQN